jgi:hypothetical protein
LDQILVKAFARWLEFAEERRAAMRLDPVAFTFFRKGALRYGLETWRENTLERLLEREEWSLAEDHHRTTALRRFLSRWISRVADAVAEEDALEHRARVISGECLAGWYVEMWVSHRRREHAARRCVCGWRRFAARRRGIRARLAIARDRRYAATTRRTFDAWFATWVAEAKATLSLALAKRFAARRATRAWRLATRAASRDRRSRDAADEHARARFLGHAFAALSSHWARNVLTRTFAHGRQKNLVSRAWKGWASEAWERRMRRVEDELGSVEALGFVEPPEAFSFGGLETTRVGEPSRKVSPTRGFSLSHSPTNGPWLSAGPGKKSKPPLGDREKWKFY